MSAPRLDPTTLDEAEGGEVAEVLAALRALSQKVSSPMIRVCLEATHDDIAYLTGTAAEEETSADDAGNLGLE